MQRSLYLAAYDIRDAARLRKALHCTRQHATGGQKSVHECWLSTPEKSQLLRDIHALLDDGQDHFALIPLDARRPALLMGTAKAPADPDFYLFE